jgi:hypothetical protein
MLSALGPTVVAQPATYFDVDMYRKLVDQADNTMLLNGLECAFLFKSSAGDMQISPVEGRVALYQLCQPFSSTS